MNRHDRRVFSAVASAVAYGQLRVSGRVTQTTTAQPTAFTVEVRPDNLIVAGPNNFRASFRGFDETTVDVVIDGVASVQCTVASNTFKKSKRRNTTTANIERNEARGACIRLDAADPDYAWFWLELYSP